MLYLHIGEPQAGQGEETPEGHIIRYAPDTSQVVGLTVLGARRILQRDGRLGITVPGMVEPAKADPPSDTPASPNGAAAADAPPVPSPRG